MYIVSNVPTLEVLKDVQMSRTFCNVLQYVEPAKINATKPKPKKLEASDVDQPLWEASECV